MPPAQNPHQTVTCWHSYGCICSSLITRGFSESQTRQFWRLTKPSRWKCALSLRIILRQTFIIFKILFDNKDTLLHRIKLGFLLILNSQLSNCSFFRIANNINAIKSRVNFGTPYIYILWRVIISKHANYVDGGRGLSRGERSWWHKALLPVLRIAWRRRRPNWTRKTWK